MKKLLSLPPNLVRQETAGRTVFHELTNLPADEFFCSCDPVGHKLGSGGGTVWLLEACRQAEGGTAPFDEWLSAGRRILVHAGGQSRRLPAYAPSGKALMPVPVIRWERGQRLDQTLLSMQLPLFERIMASAPQGLNTMVVSGDVLVRATQALPPVPQADVVCYGLWLDATVACHHGVFLSDRSTPQVLKCMLQKPSVEQLKELQKQHYYLTDIGVWMLSDRAVQLLRERSLAPDGLRYYDLYSDFGRALGTNPQVDDPALRQLTVAVVPLTGGEFYHFGTSREMISSTLALQNRVQDQRRIMHHDRKPHPSIFVQNAVVARPFSEQNRNVWVENSWLGPHWQLSADHVVTGVPQNDWHVALQPGECVDVVPIGERHYAVRLYQMDDRFDGDEQQRRQYPVVEWADVEAVLQHRPVAASRLLSAEELATEANLPRLFRQREALSAQIWPALARNWEHSVFYQLDLDHAAGEFQRLHIPLPAALGDDAPLMTRIQDAMFRGHSDEAFGLLRSGLAATSLSQRQRPAMAVLRDQIVWARSPVRIDIAGGWTDTPPFCLQEGGNVVNLAVELNGQPPLQAYVKPSADSRIILRSIDLGAMEVVETYEELAQFSRVGSPFSIPKAALALAGFLPAFSQEQHGSLREQLQAFGCGIELTLLSAIPAGSGMGTSSILAATVLGALSDFCALGWDKDEIGRRTLVLEQLLTTGGGWQDQLGGVLGGVKLLQSHAGLEQQPVARWLPSDVYTLPEYRQCHLLYYTGVTRTAKHILADIVRRMFLNQHDQLLLLREMKEHAIDMYEALQRNDFQLMGQLVRRSWQQNQALDSGTNPAAIQQIGRLVDDYCLGYKLPGAGGGGFMYMVAKDPEAAARIKTLLTAQRLNGNARFVDMSLSQTGLQVSRS